MILYFKGFPCRHVYAILDREPKPEDTIPSHLRSYEVYFDRFQEYTKVVQQQFTNLRDGPLVYKSEIDFQCSLINVGSLFCKGVIDMNHPEEFQVEKGRSVPDLMKAGFRCLSEEQDSEEWGTFDSDIGDCFWDEDGDSDMETDHANRKREQDYISSRQKRRKNMTPYQDASPLFEQLTGLIQDEEEYEIMCNAMEQAMISILQKKQKKSPQARTGSLSFPQVETKSKNRRAIPLHSPSKFKK